MLRMGDDCKHKGLILDLWDEGQSTGVIYLYSYNPEASQAKYLSPAHNIYMACLLRREEKGALMAASQSGLISSRQAVLIGQPKRLVAVVLVYSLVSLSDLASST